MIRRESEVMAALEAVKNINPKSAFQETTQTITMATLEWVLGLRGEIEI